MGNLDFAGPLGVRAVSRPSSHPPSFPDICIYPRILDNTRTARLLRLVDKGLPFPFPPLFVLYGCGWRNYASDTKQAPVRIEPETVKGDMDNFTAIFTFLFHKSLLYPTINAMNRHTPAHTVHIAASARWLNSPSMTAIRPVHKVSVKKIVCVQVILEPPFFFSAIRCHCR